MSPTAATENTEQHSKTSSATVSKTYSKKISSTYDYRFGASLPFLPSNAKTEIGEFIALGRFPTAKYCGHCHEATYRQWQESAHRNSFRAPFYVKNVDLLIKSKGIEYSRHCEGCHNPIALFSGALTPNSHIKRTFDQDGITCAVCHSITGIQGTKGTGSYVMGVPAVMVDEQGRRIPGTVPYEQIMEHPERHRQAVMRDIYRSPEFCGACHKAALPTSVTGYRWLRAITTYDEWQDSSFSQRSPLPFYKQTYASCQSCHMPSELVSKHDDGAKNGTLASHRWLGGNTAIPFYYGYGDQLRKTEEFLQRQRIGIDIFAIQQPPSTVPIAPLDATDLTLVPGKPVEVFIVVQNKGMGHSLIPEQRDFYEAWVEFSVTDATDKELYHSGYLEPDGSLEKTAHSFTNCLLDKDGHLLARHEVWERHAVAYDKTIPSGHSTIVRYQFRIPAGTTGALRLTARVNYRHFNQTYTSFVLGAKHRAYPVVELAASSQTVQIGSNVASADRRDASIEWMRWNNFGIALLDQGSYRDAANAFEQVVKLKADYGDGFTNIGLAELRGGDYSLALEQFQHALKLNPVDSRAMFYQALAELSLGKLGDAVANLQRIEKKFPQSADVHRELGLTYFLQGNDQGAVHEYESLQECEPNDLLAHYYLSLLYRRAGEPGKANLQAALYKDEKDDPASATIASHFLYQNPDSFQESLGRHVHASVMNSAVVDQLNR